MRHKGRHSLSATSAMTVARFEKRKMKLLLQIKAH